MPAQQADLTTPNIERARDPPLDVPVAATVWNDSGGVGKTTVTINTADSLGRMGFDVLVIDLDAQTGSITHHVGAVKARSQIDVTDTLINRPSELGNDILDGSQPTLDLQFDVLPASRTLEDFSKHVGAAYNGNSINILKSAIQQSKLGQRYDVFLVDAPGNRNLLVQNALAATQNAIIPIEASPKGEASLDGLREYVVGTQQTLERDGLEANLSITGIVPSIVPGQLHTTKKEALKQYDARRDEGWPIAPFFLWERTILEKAWKNERPLRSFIEDNPDMRVRKREQDIPKRFDALSNIVLTGDASAAKDEFDDFGKL